LLLATAPVANVSLSFIKDYSLISSSVSELADEIGAMHLDFNSLNLEGAVFDDSNFRDDAHLNYSGVLKA
jgi:hypothetical protein